MKAADATKFYRNNWKFPQLNQDMRIKQGICKIYLWTFPFWYRVNSNFQYFKDIFKTALLDNNFLADETFPSMLGFSFSFLFRYA